MKKVTLVGTMLILTLVLSGCHRGMHRMMERMHERGMMGERFGEMHEFGRDMMPFARGTRGGDGDGREMMAGVTHVFDKTDDGGIYQMIAEDAEDAETIAMIQERLSSMVGHSEAGDEADSEAGDGEAGDGDESDADASDEAETETDTDADADADEDSDTGTDTDTEANGNNADGERGRRQGMDRGRGMFGSGMIGGMFGRGMDGMMDDITISYSDLDDGGQITISSDNPEVVEMIHTWIDDGPMSRGERDGNGRR